MPGGGRANSVYGCSLITRSRFGRGMLVAVLIGLTVRSDIPVPYAVGAVFQNTTGRYVHLESQPTLGRLLNAMTLTAGDTLLRAPVSECIWGTYKSVVFLGPPPKSCRRGKRVDGKAINGRAHVVIDDALGSEFNVLYPVDDVPLPHTVVGPFKQCRGVALGEFECMAEPYTSVEVSGNVSSVWVHNPSYTAQAALFQGMGFVQAVLFAILAARGKTYGSSDMTSVMALAADAAAGGMITQTLLLATGRSIVGLDTEFGITAASQMELATTMWSVALATCAYLHAMQFEVLVMFPRTALNLYRLPYTKVVREMCEVPLLFSLVIIWPETSGPHFLMQLQFVCGLAISFVSGRAAGLLMYYEKNAHGTLAAAFMLIGGIATASVLCVPTVAASGAVIRGGPAFTFAVALQLHAAAGGVFFGAQSRLRQAADAASKKRALTTAASAALAASI